VTETTPIAAVELARLADLEAVVERGLQTFVPERGSKGGGVTDSVYVEMVLPPETVEKITSEVTKRVLAEIGTDRSAADRSPYLSVREAAELMRASRGRIYDLLSQRRLTRYRDGTRVLLARAEITRYLAGEA